MEKRNTLLLTVIAIATLLVAVVGATFAYFSTTQDVSSNIPVDVTTASSAAAFTAVADGSIDIVVDAHEMQQADADDNTTNTAVNGLTDTATLTVKLNAAQEGSLSKCKYSIIYTWTSDKYCLETSTEGITSAVDYDNCSDQSNAGYYFKTADVAKEFTLEATVDVKVGGVTYNTTTHGDLGIVANAMAEQNLDHVNSPITNKQITLADNSITNVDYVTLIKDAEIGSTLAAGTDSTTTATEVVWTFTARFYNSTKNQDLLMDKNFKGTISVDPDSVEC